MVHCRGDTAVASPVMVGLIALVGSGEFLPQMMDTDTHLLEGRSRRVVHLPTAAGMEGADSIARWGTMAAAHYATLDCDVTSLPVIDRHSADDPGLAAEIDEDVGLIYLSGGSPAYCAYTLRDTRVWDAIVTAWNAGASLAGCSAGAGALSTVAPDPMGGRTEVGLGLVPNMAVIPHYDRMKVFRPVFGWITRRAKPEGAEVVGIEEDTAFVGRPGESWTVFGRQSVVLVDRDGHRLSAGETATFD